MSVHFATGPRAEADALVQKWHYSHRPPSNVQVIGTWLSDGGLFGDSGPMVAACYFSIPPTRWSRPVLELSRLVRVEGPKLPPLSGLISATCRHIKAKSAADLLVSFADATQDHHGGIYQAASWCYHGQRNRRMDGVIINGTFVPGRACNAIYGTQSPDLLSQMGVGSVEPHYDDGKHLYWRALNKRGQRMATDLKLKSNSYPKPSINNCETAT